MRADMPIQIPGLTKKPFDIQRYINAYERHQSLEGAALALGVSTSAIQKAFDRYGYVIRRVVVKVRPSIYR